MRPLRVYVAGSFSDRKRIETITTELTSLGFEPTNTWQRENGESLLECAQRDLRGIDRADVMLVMADRPSTTGGYWVEIGYALGTGMPIIVVTPPYSNVFLSLPEVRTTLHLSQAFSMLRAIRKNPGWQARVIVIDKGIAEEAA